MLSNIQEIKRDLARVGTGSGNIELEVRFGTFDANGFVSGVKYAYYDRLRTYLNSIATPIITTSSITTFNGGIRSINTMMDPTVWERKTRIKNYNDRDYNIRTSISTEETLDEAPKRLAKPYTRNRHRYTYLVDHMKIELTEVTKEFKEMDVVYEIEIEYNPTSEQEQYQDALGQFNEEVKNVYLRVYGSSLLYTVSQKETLLESMKNILISDRKKENYISLVNARNLKWKDMVYGGIVGNDKLPDYYMAKRDKTTEKEIKAEGTDYAIAHKADGLRKLLVIHESGLWLVYPDDEFNLVSLPGEHSDYYSDMSGTIFDGELVKYKKAEPKERKEKYYYYAFDTIAMKGKKAVQYKDYIYRTNHIKDVLSAAPVIYDNIDISVFLKPFNVIRSPEDFYQLSARYLDSSDSLPYEEDGLMFTPIGTIYNPRNENERKRSLSVMPDIVKWKPVEKITIDFSIQHGKSGVILLFSSEKGKLVQFKGSAYTPLTNDMIDHRNELTMIVPNETIVEYAWLNGKLVPIRIRHDKSRPNRLAIALDNWEDIHNPITSDDMKGISVTAAFKYHNRIKSELFNSLGNVRTLLDIGSGYGGDINKWPKDAKILAVEPNRENMIKLEKRLQTTGKDISKNVTTLGARGQDYKIIGEQMMKIGKADAISLMLSLSFFWKDESLLDALIYTIVSNLKVGGKVIFLSIDGDTLLQTIDPVFGKRSRDMTLVLGQCEITVYPGGTYGRDVDFILPGTIVGKQREYVVYLDKLTMKLERHGIVLRQMERADKDLFLSRNARIYSSLYSYGYYEYVDKTGEKLEEIKLEQDEYYEGSDDNEVDYRDESEEYFDEMAANDDVLVPTRMKDINIITTIGDGSCFFHSLLKTLDKRYLQEKSSKRRLQMVVDFREQLANRLSWKNPKYPELTYWQSVGGGGYAKFAEFDESYSLEELSKLLKSSRYTGDEIYPLVTDMFGKRLYIIKVNKNGDVTPYTRTYLTTIIGSGEFVSITEAPIIVIRAQYNEENHGHYELVGKREGDQVRTIFAHDDPFIRELDVLFEKETGRR